MNMREAREQGLLDRFAKENEVKEPNKLFDKVLGRIAKSSESSDQASRQQERDED